ncbi:MAG: NAD(+) synthase [Candidatus Izemoplasmataceae bacterium]
MYKQDFIKIASITPTLLVANPLENVLSMLKTLEDLTASIAVFPELGITSYTANDLFFQNSLLKETKESIAYLLKHNPFKGIIIFGAPLQIDDVLYNAAFIAKGDKLLGIVPKIYLPNTQEFYEKRWFTSGKEIIKKVHSINYLNQSVPFGSLIFQSKDESVKFGVEICEDMWAPLSPGNLLSLNGANMIFNLSASNETLNKRELRRTAILDHSRRNVGAYIYTSAGVYESTSETVFSGHKVVALNGELLAETENFALESECLITDIDLGLLTFKRKLASSYRDSLNLIDFPVHKVVIDLEKTEDYQFESPFDKTPFVPKEDDILAFEKIAALQEFALIKRLKHTKSKKLLIGISGGLDSTLALIIAVRAMDQLKKDRKDIIAVTMPAKATSEKTYTQAHGLMDAFGVTKLEIPIQSHVNDHLDLIGHNHDHDITYENTQARARTMILMNLANKHEGIVLGTGDMSELALGWCTYNGDQMSMYGINAGIPKTLVKYMVAHYAKLKFDQSISKHLDSVVKTPISPELLPNQKTEDALGKYEINDFIMARFLRCGDDLARIKWLLAKTFDLNEETCHNYVEHFFKRFYSQQFKRQALPDGPKVLDVSLSPRGDFRMVSDVDKQKG